MSWFKQRPRRTIFALIILMIALPSAFAGYVAYWVQHPQKNEKTTVFIEKGASLSQIAQTLNQYEVLNSPLLFK
ncbi:MAG: hypothetical protein U1A05_00415, partial [Alphaproteobacteria bacterium]|nr:hypothetical protein [Alphaproteobacteria bacterium]